jgi:hypothetical protein
MNYKYKLQGFWGKAIALGTLMLMAGCDKYLEEKSNKALVVPSTLEDLQALLDDNYTMNTYTPGYGQTSDDDFFVTMASYNSLNERNRGVYIWEAVPYTYPNDWSYSYHAVYNANYCLEKVRELPRPATAPAQWDNVAGSAYFYRGYYYLSLLWQHALGYDSSTAGSDAGVVLRLSSDFTQPSQRSSVVEGYRQVENDLKMAAAALPLRTEHPIRPSRAAAWGALARAYLSMRRYDSAGYYAGQALGIYNSLIDYNSSEVTAASMTPFKMYNQETVFYSTQTNNYSPKSPTYALTDTLLYRSYAADDLRREAFFYPNQGYYSFKGSYADSRLTFFSGITTAELYLIRAECRARAGRQAEALADLNTLLAKRWKTGRFVPVPDRGKAASLDAILLERRKELVMRGLRWPDIKRLNKEGAGIVPRRLVDGKTYELRPNEARYALPLPQDVIDMTGISQN